MAIDINGPTDTITSTIYGVEVVSGLINAYNEANAAFNRANNITGIPFIDTITATNGLAVNTGSFLTISGNGTFALTGNNATTGAVGVVQLNDTVQSTSATQAATANSVNTAWAYAQTAFNLANTHIAPITNIYNEANAAFLTANVVITAYANANAALAEANSFQSIINSAFTLANTSIQEGGGGMAGQMSATLTVPALTANVGINVGFIVANSNVTAANVNSTGVVNSAIIAITGPITGNNTLTPTIGYYNLSLREAGQIVVYSNTVTLNVNIGSGSTGTNLPIGYRTIFMQANTGNVVFKANGCNLFSRIGVSMQTLGQYGMATLVCYSSNNYVLSGEIS